MHYNTYTFTRERRRFGRQPLLSDRTQLMLSIQPSQKMRMHFILKNPVESGTQLSDQKGLSEMITENVSYAEHGMFHYEGGWPREINIRDEEQTLRYRKKVEREDNWGGQVINLIERSYELVEQNSAINIYEEFFKNLPSDLGTDIRTPFEARPYNVFHDLPMPPRPLVTIDWAPNTRHIFLTQYTNFDDAEQSTDTAEGEEMAQAVTYSSFYAWDINNALKPDIIFESPEQVFKALFCPKDENYIACGCQSGKVAVWDSRKGGPPLLVSPLEGAHRDTVVAICWVHSKSNSEFYSGSVDGEIKFWDGREMDEPIQELLLDPEPTDDQLRRRAHGVTCLEFEYTIPVRFIATSDMGYVFIGNRKGLLPTESLLSNYKIFAGPIRTIERNPFFVKNFLIVGDWCAKIWAEECKGSPTTLLIKKKNQLLCGTWSTARCSLFVTGDNAGELDFWDLLLNQRFPSFTLYFNKPITYVKFSNDGTILLVGLETGSVHALEMDAAMKQSTSKDKILIAALFEREQHRCKLLEQRVEEMKLKLSQPIEEDARSDPMPIEEELLEGLDPNDPTQYLAILARDFEFKEVLLAFKEGILKVDQKRQDRDFVMELTDFETQFMLREEDNALQQQSDEGASDLDPYSSYD